MKGGFFIKRARYRPKKPDVFYTGLFRFEIINIAYRKK
jgi:hypothetical protein